MSEKQEETYESIIADFKPTIRKEDYQVVKAEMKRRDIDPSKYKNIFCVKDSVQTDEADVIHVKASLQPNAPATAHADVIEFDAKPEDFGFAKKTELLVCTLEEGIVNIRTRRVEQGFFLFKVTVKTEAKNLWLFWIRGHAYVMDMNTRDLVTNDVTGFEEIKEFSNFKKQFPKRIHITPYQYSQLQKLDLVKSAYRTNEGFLAPPIGAK